MNRSIHLAFFLSLILFSACADSNVPPIASNSDVSDGDSVLFSFAFVGCNRVQKSDLKNANTNSSTANIPELQRTLDEVSKLDPIPKYFFFLGDLVLGLQKDQTVLNGQLQAWVNQVQDQHFSLFAKSGIRMVAMPGNHEMLYKDSLDQEVPWKESIAIWQRAMSGMMPAEKLNRVHGKDSLVNRQTYSFDYQNVHFIVLNTDTWNDSLQIGTFPLAWVESDIIEASLNRSTAHTFILSHKPVWVTPDNGKDDTVQDSLGKALWKVMQRYHVEALLSAHSHQYQRSEHKKGESVQIVAGNGGSPYNSKLDSKEQFMGFCVVNVMANGDLIMKSMGRCMDEKDYLAKIPNDQRTLLRDSVNLKWGEERKKWPKALLNPCGK